MVPKIRPYFCLPEKETTMLAHHAISILQCAHKMAVASSYVCYYGHNAAFSGLLQLN